MMNSQLELVFTFRSSENARTVYWANVIRDRNFVINGKPSYFWFGDADNDVDGSPYWREDKYGQRETRWRYKGLPINGDIIPFIVVPPAMIKMTPEIVGGCLGTAEWHDQIVKCVVGDSGPTTKTGELSPAALRALGLPAPHNGNGGLDTQEVLYRIWPGIPASLDINGQNYTFDLQRS